MAMLDEKRSLIRDRAKGYRDMVYYIPKTSRAYMKACLQAHEAVCRFMPQCKRKTITNKEMKTLVMRFAVFNEQGRQAMLRDILYETESKRCSLAELINKWHDMKIFEGLGSKQMKAINNCKRTLLDFFNSCNMATTDDFEPDTAHKFIAWRSKTSYGNNKATSASTIKKDLASLKSLAKMASVHGYVPNGNMWDDAKVRAIAGVNKKIVEPLSIESQTELLNSFKDNQAYHDIALLLLIIGIRTFSTPETRSDVPS
jgi:hypothetical protein